MLIDVITRRLWPSRVMRADRAVRQDAEDLIRIWGESAYTVAATMSWREDMGLVFAAEAGHWSRVKRAVGRHFARTEDEPKAEFSAGPDQVWLYA